MGTPWEVPAEVRELHVGMVREFFARNMWRGRIAPYSTDRGIVTIDAIYARSYLPAILLGLLSNLPPQDHAVFAAAARLGLQRVVWASSETTLGLPFERPPDYAPVDEAHMYPETSYALSKVLGEEMARQFSRWSGIPIIGLRFSNIMVRDDYERFPSYWDDPHLRKWNLWGYVDESHVAQSVRLALEADVDGADSFIIAAADTVMKRPSRELMAAVFPGVPVADDVDGTDTLLAIGKARAKLGYSPQSSWRELY
jgi:nucleoside-diphosphate-sugar epimerase